MARAMTSAVASIGDICAERRKRGVAMAKRAAEDAATGAGAGAGAGALTEHAEGVR